MSSTAVLARAHTRIVHFDNECVIIPEPERRKNRPKIVTKSYSLPLWKRRVSPNPIVPAGTSTAEQDSQTPTEDHVMVKVPLPSFSLRSPSRSPEQPCMTPASIMVHNRKPSYSPERSPHAPVRRPSLPLPPRSPPLATVPLRPCCPECVAIAEAALKQGEDWEENFSRAARRKRSLSVDSVSRPHLHSPRILHQADMAAVFPSVKVDEVDCRRTPSASTSEGGSLLGPSISRRGATASSALPNVISLNDDPSRPIPVAAPAPTPIIEEDEEQLFPLPSPRRTPTSSPAPSPKGSSSSLILAAKHASLRVSPRSGSPLPGRPPSLLPRSRSSPVPAPTSNTEEEEKGLSASASAPDGIREAAAPRAQSPPPATSAASPSALSIPLVESSPRLPAHGSPKLGSPQASPRTPSARPPGSWSSFFRAGAVVLRGVSSMGGASV